MHPLLFTKDNAGCEQLMAALEECHAKGFIWKAAGMCNDAKQQLTECLRAERLKNQSLNRNSVQDKRSKIRQKWKEIDENS